MAAFSALTRASGVSPFTASVALGYVARILSKRSLNGDKAGRYANVFYTIPCYTMQRSPAHYVEHLKSYSPILIPTAYATIHDQFQGVKGYERNTIMQDDYRYHGGDDRAD